MGISAQLSILPPLIPTHIFLFNACFSSSDSWNARFIKSDIGANIFFSYIALVIDLIKNINRLGTLKSLEPFIKNAFIFFLIMLINIFTLRFENHYLYVSFFKIYFL